MTHGLHFLQGFASLTSFMILGSYGSKGFAALRVIVRRWWVQVGMNTLCPYLYPFKVARRLETTFDVLDSPCVAAAKNERQRSDVANFCTMELLKKVGKLLQVGVVLPDCLTSPAMKESKAYKTYLANTGEVPPKAARKFKKASPSKKDSVPVQADEEPVQKGKKV
ncbi:hypothetical protein Tco_0360942 [Tanacetum coccineum]